MQLQLSISKMRNVIMMPCDISNAKYWALASIWWIDKRDKETRRTQAELTSTYIGLQSSPIGINFAITHYDSLYDIGGANLWDLKPAY